MIRDVAPFPTVQPADAREPLTDTDVAIFAATALRRHKARADVREARRLRGWAVARTAAALLRQDFGAARVIAFGSLLQPAVFDERSDIDLAVSGIADDRYFQAVAAVNGLDIEFSVDLVEPESCRPVLRSVIERDGFDL